MSTFLAFFGLSLVYARKPSGLIVLYCQVFVPEKDGYESNTSSFFLLDHKQLVKCY